VNLIEQNLVAQDNILAALTDVYAQTANVRKNVEEVLKRREITISSLVASYDAYEDLLTKSSKGLEFYRKLEINVSKLLTRVKSTCKVQEEEREQILAQDNKNTYEKTDMTVSSTYDPGRARSSNGPKLKDYLNSRIESGTGYQNPYYNLYKAHTTMQMDSVAKSLATDVADKTLMQSPTTGGSAQSLAASEVPSSSMKSSQHYYPTTYTDYRTNSYSYGTQNYYENLVVSNTLNHTYLPANNANTANIYHQPAVPAADTSNSNIQYPTNSYVSNGQALSTSAIGQEKFLAATHSNYNISNTALQYDAYQSPAGYSSYNIATPYASNQEKPATAAAAAATAAVTVKSGTTEILPNLQKIQTISQMPASTMNTASSSNVTTDSQGRPYGVVQSNQQYDNQQQTTLNQELPQNGQNAVRPQQTLSTKDSALVSNYSLPQTNTHPTDMTYPQNYQSTVYYNPADLQTQRVPYTHSTYEANTVVPPTQYAQSQQPAVSNQQPMHSVTLANEISISYSASNLHGVNPVQYPQHTAEQTKQNYADKTSYGGYGTTQVNPVTPNYASTYQNYQTSTVTDVTYQQGNNMLPTDASNTYVYLNNSNNTEMIQSHVKPTTVQNYAQSYQYSHQVPYSEYAQYPNYSQGQNYAYMSNAHGTNAIAYTYNPANQAQGYTYISNSQNVQTTQALEVTSSTATISNVSNSYQQQETNARYTNAGNNAVSQTPSSQYSPVYSPQTESDTYYTTPYGLQVQGQGIFLIFR